MKNDGFSYREIANTIQCSLGMVQNNIKDLNQKKKAEDQENIATNEKTNFTSS